MRKQIEIPDNVAINFFKSELNGTPSGHVHSARCPVCGDSQNNKHRKRMYLLKKERNWMVYCHNCAYASSLIWFVKDFFPMRYDAMINQSVNDFFKKESNDDKMENLIDVLSSKVKAKLKIDSNPVKVYLDKKCVPLTKDCGNNDVQEDVTGQIIKLKERRLSDEFISSLYYSLEGDYKDRVIIPVFNEDDQPFYFQAKGTKKWHRNNKYINWESEDVTEKPLYNEKHVDGNNVVYIIEGLLDSLFVKNSISTMGAAISHTKIRSISSKFPKRVWVMDNDRTGMKLTKKLFNSGETCVLFDRKYKKIKDLNDLAILLKKNDLTEIVKESSYNCIEGLVEISRR